MTRLGFQPSLLALAASAQRTLPLRLQVSPFCISDLIGVVFKSGNNHGHISRRLGSDSLLAFLRLHNMSKEFMAIFVI